MRFALWRSMSVQMTLVSRWARLRDLPPELLSFVSCSAMRSIGCLKQDLARSVSGCALTGVASESASSARDKGFCSPSWGTPCCDPD